MKSLSSLSLPMHRLPIPTTYWTKPGQYGSVGRESSEASKSVWFDSWSGYMLELQAQSQVGEVGEGDAGGSQLMFLFLPVSVSPLPSLSKISKNVKKTNWTRVVHLLNPWTYSNTLLWPKDQFLQGFTLIVHILWDLLSVYIMTYMHIYSIM